MIVKVSLSYPFIAIYTPGSQKCIVSLSQCIDIYIELLMKSAVITFLFHGVQFGSLKVLQRSRCDHVYHYKGKKIRDVLRSDI